jgi:hypothetical protein
MSGWRRCEPSSGKGYVQREYKYAVDRKKPFFALVVSDDHHEERVRNFGLKVDEREHPQRAPRVEECRHPTPLRLPERQEGYQSSHPPEAAGVGAESGRGRLGNSIPDSGIISAGPATTHSPA